MKFSVNQWISKARGKVIYLYAKVEIYTVTILQFYHRWPIPDMHKKLNKLICRFDYILIQLNELVIIYINNICIIVLPESPIKLVFPIKKYYI